MLVLQAYVQRFKALYERKMDWDWTDQDIPEEIQEFIANMFKVFEGE